MNGIKKVKIAGAAGLVALMLMVGAAGITADALESRGDCGHSWTVDINYDTITWTESHMVGLKTCYITHTSKCYDVQCRGCGVILKNVREDINVVHSIDHKIIN